jgi:hypothetical protein
MKESMVALTRHMRERQGMQKGARGSKRGARGSREGVEREQEGSKATAFYFPGYNCPVAYRARFN